VAAPNKPASGDAPNAETRLRFDDGFRRRNEELDAV
jgi:hypothetical protein